MAGTIGVWFNPTLPCASRCCKSFMAIHLVASSADPFKLTAMLLYVIMDLGGRADAMSNRDPSTLGGPRPGRQRLGSRAATATRKPANPLTSPCRQAGTSSKWSFAQATCRVTYGRMCLTQVPWFTACAEPLGRSATSATSSMQTVDDLPGCAIEQHLVGAFLRALTNRTGKFKLYIFTYLRRFQLLEPSLDLCRDDTRKTA